MSPRWLLSFQPKNRRLCAPAVEQGTFSCAQRKHNLYLSRQRIAWWITTYRHCTDARSIVTATPFTFTALLPCCTAAPSNRIGCTTSTASTASPSIWLLQSIFAHHPPPPPPPPPPPGQLPGTVHVMSTLHVITCCIVFCIISCFL